MNAPILEWIRQPQRTKKEIARATIAFKKLVGENFCVSMLDSVETNGTHVFWKKNTFYEYRNNKDTKVLMI